MDDKQQDEALRQLLPWYVNGTLNPEERAQVEALLQRSAEAAGEVEVLRKLQDTIHTEEAETAPLELSWRRFQKTLPDNKQTSKPSFPWPKVASVAAVMIIAVQFALLVNLPRPADVELLGGDAVQTRMAEGYRLLQVVFLEDANWQAVQALITSADGEIVAGPSALGILVVRIPDEGATESLALFRASPLVEHIQVAGDDGAGH